MVWFFLVYRLGFNGFVWVILLLHSLDVVLCVTHYGAPLPYKSVGGLVGDASIAIVIMIVVMNKLCH